MARCILHCPELEDSLVDFRNEGGDTASTRSVKPELRAEDPGNLVKQLGKYTTANTNMALAA